MFAARALAKRRAARATGANSVSSETTPTKPHQTKAATEDNEGSDASSLGQGGIGDDDENEAQQDSTGSSLPLLPRSGAPIHSFMTAGNTVVGVVIESQVSSKFKFGPIDDTCFWTRLIRTGLASRFDAIHKLGLIDAIKMDSAFTGLGAEFWVASAMGIPTDQQASVSEARKEVRDIFMQKRSHFVAHIFESIEDQITGTGMCHRTGRRVSLQKVCRVLKVVLFENRRHLLVAGPPCQPYSRLSGSNTRAGCEHHDLFFTIFGVPGRSGIDGVGLIDYILVNLPHCIIIEEVSTFKDADSRNKCFFPLKEMLHKIMNARDPQDPQRGAYYTAAHVFDVEPGKFVNMHRPRRSLLATRDVLNAKHLGSS